MPYYSLLSVELRVSLSFLCSSLIPLRASSSFYTGTFALSFCYLDTRTRTHTHTHAHNKNNSPGYTRAIESPSLYSALSRLHPSMYFSRDRMAFLSSHRLFRCVRTFVRLIPADSCAYVCLSVLVSLSACLSVGHFFPQWFVSLFSHSF